MRPTVTTPGNAQAGTAAEEPNPQPFSATARESDVITRLCRPHATARSRSKPQRVNQNHALTTLMVWLLSGHRGSAGFRGRVKLTSRTNGGEVAILEHPFAVGAITAAHRHTREDETLDRDRAGRVRELLPRVG